MEQSLAMPACTVDVQQRGCKTSCPLVTYAVMQSLKYGRDNQRLTCGLVGLVPKTVWVQE